MSGLVRAPAMAALVVPCCNRTPSDRAPEPQASQTEPASMTANDDDERARAMRERLVRQIEFFDGPWGAPSWDASVLSAMREVPRDDGRVDVDPGSCPVCNP